MENTKKSLILFLFLIFLNFNQVLSQTVETLPANSLDGIKTSEYISIAFMISVLILKITAFVLGFLIVKMGHNTLVRGITGEFDFGFSGSGFTTKLKSASPGLLFVLMGALIIIWSMAVEKPLEVASIPSTTTETIIQTPGGSTTETKDPIPDAETKDTTKTN